MDGVIVDLVDRPHLGYTKEDKPFPRGELRVKSETVSPGYYNNPEETKKAFEDGWFYTGTIDFAHTFAKKLQGTSVLSMTMAESMLSIEQRLSSCSPMVKPIFRTDSRQCEFSSISESNCL